MPRPRKADKPPLRTPQLNTRLAAEEYLKLETVCRMEEKTKTEILRKALLLYLDGYEKRAEDQARDRLAAAVEAMQAGHKKDTERIAKMVARVMMDVGTVQQVFFDRASKEDRNELWKVARQRAAERLRHKRKDGDPEATELMKDALSS